MRLLDLPTDTLAEIVKRTAFSQINKVALINKHFYELTLKQLDKFDFTDSFGLTNQDIFRSSISTEFIDELMNILDAKQISQMYHIRRLFKFVKRSRAHIRYDKVFYPSNIRMHHKIYQISDKSDVEQDYRIFQLLILIAEEFLSDRQQRLLRASLIIQMVSYFGEYFKREMASICQSKENQAILDEKINYFINYNKNTVSEYIYSLPISVLDFNLYDWYSIGMTSLISDDYLSMSIPHDDALKFKEIGIFNKMQIRSLYNLDDELISNNISVLMDFINFEEQYDIRVTMTGMLFSYLNDIAKNKDKKSISKLPIIPKANEFNEELFDTGNPFDGHMIVTKKVLEESILLFQDK